MLKLDNITVKYGDNTVIDNFSIDLSEHNVIALVGPSGCGKTTLLNAIAGLVPLDSGEIITDKKIGFMFQEPRLFLHLTALQNVNAVLSDKKETLDKAKKALETVGFFDFDKYPHELSGGMQQRVALARTLVSDSELLLLDEPFSALDSESKEKLLDLIKKDGRQTVFVTHDQNDTKIADKIVEM